MVHSKINISNEVAKFHKELTGHASFMIGFPGNLNNDFSDLYPFFDFIINNVGDPFDTGASYKMDSKWYEKKVLSFFHKIYNFDPPSFDEKGNQKSPWGYLTTGGTEGNMTGLLLGRTKYPEGLLYSTKSGHYSIKKTSLILQMPISEIKSSLNGEIDYDDFSKQLYTKKETPIINLTIGTTFHGAIDSIDKVLSLLKETSHDKFYIHCDAALHGGFLPFLQIENEVDFRKPIDSIAISAHKFFGIPFPSGIFLSKEKPGCEYIKYVDSHDTTISGSRNGQLAILLWSLILEKGIEGFEEDASICIENAKYLKDRLQNLGKNPFLHENSNIVTFDLPNEKIINFWQLSTEKDRAHVVVMPHVTEELLDFFIKDLSQK